MFPTDEIIVGQKPSTDLKSKGIHVDSGLLGGTERLMKTHKGLGDVDLASEPTPTTIGRTRLKWVRGDSSTEIETQVLRGITKKYKPRVRKYNGRRGKGHFLVFRRH